MLDIIPYLVNRVFAMNNSDYEIILRNWRIKSPVLNSSTHIQDSFDPSGQLTIFSDADGAQWELEIISENQYSRKLALAETMELLESNGCSLILPYQRNSLGQFITFYTGQLCMLRPCMSGIATPRNQWLTDDWRADAIAAFIINLRQASDKISVPEGGNPFSIIDFVKRKTEALNRHRPEMGESLSSVYSCLENDLFSVLYSLPTAFCHGDFKPENMVWENDSIQSVLNWEHCGLKPEAYDAALLVGCIGFKNPDALISDFTRRLILQLREASIYQDETWEVFFELTLATRYLWLSEWMRKHNKKNRDLEMLFMNLLTTQKKYILKKWDLA